VALVALAVRVPQVMTANLAIRRNARLMYL
jgi:hypothetical protein